jgi:hypothetical protein
VRRRKRASLPGAIETEGGPSPDGCVEREKGGGDRDKLLE